jgi:branched-chain amino acid transport system permease protein
MTEVLQVGFNGVSFGASLALVAVGLTLVFGILRIVNFAHGVMFMLGAYVTYYMTTSLGLGYFVAVVGAGIALGLFGILLDLVIFRRFRGLLLEGAIAAIALALLIESLALVVFGGVAKHVESPFANSVVDIGGVRLVGQRLFVIGAAAVLIFALAWFVGATRHGRALRAVQQDPEVARLQGIDVDRMTVLAFAIGGALAGLAGALIAPDQLLFPSMGETPLLLAFVVIIVGGMGSVGGALVAALAVGILQSAVSTYWIPQAASWTSFALALAILTVRPQGLFGHE